jgi:hypothetical protein
MLDTLHTRVPPVYLAIKDKSDTDKAWSDKMIGTYRSINTDRLIDDKS